MPRSAGNRSSTARLVAVLVALVALGGVLAPAAQAKCERIRWQIKWVPDITGATGGSLIQVPVCEDGTPNAQPTKAKAKPRKPTPAQLRALRYRPTEAVSATVRQRMIDQLVHDEQDEQLRADIASGRFIQAFASALRKQHDWSTHDLGDMYSFAYLQAWMTANGKTHTSTAVDRAVRRELRDRLALSRKFGGASDAKQQETAEWFGSWTILLIGTLNYLRTTGDAARIEEFRDHVRERLSAPDLFGVDLTRARLTRHGIE